MAAITFVLLKMEWLDMAETQHIMILAQKIEVTDVILVFFLEMMEIQGMATAAPLLDILKLALHVPLIQLQLHFLISDMKFEEMDLILDTGIEMMEIW